MQLRVRFHSALKSHKNIRIPNLVSSWTTLESVDFAALDDIIMRKTTLRSKKFEENIQKRGQVAKKPKDVSDSSLNNRRLAI